jgi:hypothetical protein
MIKLLSYQFVGFLGAVRRKQRLNAVSTLPRRLLIVGIGVEDSRGTGELFAAEDDRRRRLKSPTRSQRETRTDRYYLFIVLLFI